MVGDPSTFLKPAWRDHLRGARWGMAPHLKRGEEEGTSEAASSAIYWLVQVMTVISGGQFHRKGRKDQPRPRLT